VAVSDRSLVPHLRLRRRRRHRSLLKDGHSTLQCGRPCCDSWRPRTASVYIRTAVIAIDAGFDARVVHKTHSSLFLGDGMTDTISRTVGDFQLVLSIFFTDI